MKLLFVHQNYPGPFRHLAPALARSPDHRVAALHMRSDLPDRVDGVQLVSYRPSRNSTRDVHPWLRDLETKTIRGEAAFRAASALRGRGYEPDIVIGHPGWGEMMFLKDVWPQARMAVHCDYYFRRDGGDVGFDPEFVTPDPLDASRIAFRNLHLDMTLREADAGLAPTQFQADAFPGFFRQWITVVPDGIDTVRFAPRADAVVDVGEGLVLTRDDEVVSFCAPVLEPGSGYHIFMRALPELLAARPAAHIVIAGGEGAPADWPSAGLSWKQTFIDEVRLLVGPADWARVHFMGRPDQRGRLALAQVSRVHVHLSYPFPLSPYLIEAMSAGCAVVAGDTEPVREAVTHGESGILVDYFDVPGVAASIASLLADAAMRTELGARARAVACSGWDLNAVSLPRAKAWLEAVAA